VSTGQNSRVHLEVSESGRDGLLANFPVNRCKELVHVAEERKGHTSGTALWISRQNLTRDLQRLRNVLNNPQQHVPKSDSILIKTT
jgi:hypothetical protein